MSIAGTKRGNQMDYTERSNAYFKQDAIKHNHVEKNIAVFFTPKQLKRMRKKELSASKREAAKFGMVTTKAPF